MVFLTACSITDNARIIGSDLFNIEVISPEDVANEKMNIAFVKHEYAVSINDYYFAQVWRDVAISGGVNEPISHF